MLTGQRRCLNRKILDKCGCAQALAHCALPEFLDEFAVAEATVVMNRWVFLQAKAIGDPT
ncbi:Uncharacterised protein [Mycobacterium tuberculosis]|nr:Uncharacterised protein [Mycobacterium tuberculosis]COY44279.1 Uncharacterised protein [Mycobacterium tuberculosis]